MPDLAALTRPNVWLRVVHLLLGSALAVSFAMVDAVLVVVYRDVGLPGLAVTLLGIVTVVTPPVLLGLLAPMRPVQAAAAQTLLGVRFRDGVPGPARGVEERVRSAAWFVAHVVAGAVVAAAVVLLVAFGPALVAAPFGAEPGSEVLGLVPVQGDWRDAWLPVGGVLALGVAVAVPALLGAGLARLAPTLLDTSIAERLQRLEAETARQAEHRRIARELHDSVGHALSLVTLQAAAARTVLGRDEEFVARALTAIETASRSATDELDHMLGVLRSAGDAAASRTHVPDLGDLEDLVAGTRAAGLTVTLDMEGDVAGVPRVVSREAYRIVQEGLTNVMRHATAPAHLQVVCGRAGLRVDVTNPLGPGPRGLGPRRRQGLGASTGHGLRGVADRVAALGGRVTSGAREEPDGARVWSLSVELPT